MSHHSQRLRRDGKLADPPTERFHRTPYNGSIAQKTKFPCSGVGSDPSALGFLGYPVLWVLTGLKREREEGTDSNNSRWKLV